MQHSIQENGFQQTDPAVWHYRDARMVTGDSTIRTAKENFCDNFDYLREELGMTWYEVSDVLEVSKSTISRWKSGETEPSYADLDRIATLFDVTVQDLFNDPTEKPRHPRIQPAPPGKSRKIDLETAIRVVTEAARKGQEKGG